jgi:hypothetical protein
MKRFSVAHSNTGKISDIALQTNLFSHSVGTVGSLPGDEAAGHQAMSAFVFPLSHTSSWPRGLRPIKHWDRGFESHLMSACVYSGFVLSSVEAAALRRADPQSKESYRLCIKSRN